MMQKTTITRFNSFLNLLIILFSFALINAQEDELRIACIGNSITHGSHLDNPKKESYPSQLSEMLSKIYENRCIVRNYGFSGRNMLRNANNPIWKEQGFAEAVKWKPDICLILLGTNDSTPVLWNNLEEEFLVDYLKMIETFKDSNPQTNFIVGIPTPIWKGHPYGGKNWEEKHNDSILVNGIIPRIKTVSEKTGAALIDFYTPFADHIELFPDKLHPNAKGANYMAKIILEVMVKNNMIH